MTISSLIIILEYACDFTQVLIAGLSYLPEQFIMLRAKRSLRR